MNCGDIAEILDDRNIGALGDAERSEVEAHLAACPDCARDWELHAAFAALPDMREPAGFAAACRARIAVGSLAGRRRHVRSHLVVICVLAAVAAAAAMLAIALRTPEQTVAMVAQESMVVPDSPAEPLPEVAAPVEQATGLKGAPVVAAAPVPEAPKFTVHILPVKNDATEPASRAAIDALQAAVVRELRAVPGLTLIEADGPGNTRDVPVDFSVAVRGGTSSGDALFSADVIADQRGPDGKVRGMSGTGTSGVAACPVADTRQISNCRDPSTIAAMAVDRMRKSFFPPDPAMRLQLQATLLDAKLRPDERLRALSDLAMRFTETPGTGNALKDPAVVRGAIDLATSTSDPAQRAQIWRTMRGVRNPDLIQPLLAAAGQDVDANARQEAVVTLAADFVEEASVHTALEAIAREDTRPLVRALAQRGLSGEAFWKEYVSGSLMDEGRSDADRVEAFMYHVIVRGRQAGSTANATPQETREVLDDEAIRVLAVVLPRNLASRPRDMGQKVLALMNVAQLIEHPAIDRMVIDNLAGGIEPLAWLQIASGMMRRRSDDPALLAALEKIANEGASPEVRQYAGRVLQVQPTPAAAAPQAR
jgi:hypothetical protein